MSRLHARVDPDARRALETYLEEVPGGVGAIEDLRVRRETVARRTAERTADLPVPEHIEVAEATVPGYAGGPDVRLRTYRPRGSGRRLPGVIVIRGGGMVLGSLEGEHHPCLHLSDRLGALVVQIDYRLAPEHPAPAAVEDCYAGVVGIVERADELGLDPTRLAVYGRSAGGGLAAGALLMARDHGGPVVRLALLAYPMLDDRCETPSSHEIVDLGVWDRATNLEAWAWVLGDRVGTPDVSPYVAPARMPSVAGLPPTFLDVGELDLFRDEVVTFGQRLAQAAVPTELHLWPGAYHASESFAPDAPLSRRIMATRIAALERALGLDPG